MTESSQEILELSGAIAEGFVNLLPKPIAMSTTQIGFCKCQTPANELLSKWFISDKYYNGQMNGRRDDGRFEIQSFEYKVHLGPTENYSGLLSLYLKKLRIRRVRHFPSSSRQIWSGSQGWPIATVTTLPKRLQKTWSEIETMPITLLEKELNLSLSSFFISSWHSGLGSASTSFPNRTKTEEDSCSN